ncbi:sigma-54 interaction domain-containing protein [Caballeronia mineralivorans]|jgi:transcriptional regulator with PAS, ATPase and Fis domain|uniref:sigma-54 interaction domain-containing protein n=1 Tax=Caballeronia mineralivorans TaxID=2010198 RepID=UPI0023F455CC|nr:sigma 54-interacting transcriptional regulator [Caballeronia mineralivorans]MDB5788844.1 signal-transduction and transcriptional-control protein [Caballeronia mineralivorans]MEA3101357.1 sigma-54 dependent transcriptional regulator, acetoin dehydrogenase operon transcriptional [Caballeronia mineralivorans]
MDHEARRAGDDTGNLQVAFDNESWRAARRHAAASAQALVFALDAEGVRLDDPIEVERSLCFPVGAELETLLAFAKADTAFYPGEVIDLKTTGIPSLQICVVRSNVELHDVFLFAIRPPCTRGAESDLPSLLKMLSITLEVVLRSYFELAAHHTLVEEQRAIIDHIGDGLMVFAQGGVVRHVNAVAGRILGIDPATSVGKPLEQLIDFKPIIAPIFSTGVGYIDRELIIDSPARHLHLLDTAIPIKNGGGKVVSVVNTFREIKRVRKIAGKYAGNYARYTFDNIVGHGAGLQSAVEAARKAARGAANLLLSGESGVGKEVFAQAIHNGSLRESQPFIAINCAALPHDLIESELFGHAPGSFTGATRDGRPGKFESADGGTVFLDEISELPIDVQAKLLRVLQEREVTRLGDTKGIPIDVRIICASNRDLQAMVRDKEFREDLYYRCNVIEIPIPPLRSRLEDIPVTANFFLSKYSTLLNKNIYGFSANALRQLNDYAWPGNVRELENLVERIVNLSDGGNIADVAEFLRTGSSAKPIAQTSTTAAPDTSSVISLRDAERQAIEHALAACNCNVTRCATLLKVSKPALYAKLKRHHIKIERSLA